MLMRSKMVGENKAVYKECQGIGRKLVGGVVRLC